jgi:hypothetical protein
VSGSGSLSSTRTRRVTMERLRSRQLKIWMSVPPARHSLPKRDFFPIGSNLSRPSASGRPADDGPKRPTHKTSGGFRRPEQSLA